MVLLYLITPSFQNYAIVRVQDNIESVIVRLIITIPCQLLQTIQCFLRVTFTIENVQQIGMLIIKMEPAHEIMDLFVPRKLILQTRMHSHPAGLDVLPRTAKALARLPGCAGSPEPSLVAYVKSIIMS